MASRHPSIDLDEDVAERLEARGKENRLSAEELAKVYIEEGLRMEAHPGIVFKAGPAGRRAAVVIGPDVWQVMGFYLELKGPAEKRIKRTAKFATLDPWQVETVLRYYAEYQDEIDFWIRRNDEEAELAYSEWKREQELSGRELP